MEPRFVKKELRTNLGEDNFIFVGSTSDMFGDWVEIGWIEKVLEHCRGYPENTYLFQSKNPARFSDFLGKFPPKFLLGTTIETNWDTDDISAAPNPRERFSAMLSIPKRERVMISIEPVLDFDLDVLVSWMSLIKPEFISIGADSKNHNLPEPSPEKVEDLIKELRSFTDVKIKSNLKRLVKRKSEVL